MGGMWASTQALFSVLQCALEAQMATASRMVADSAAKGTKWLQLAPQVCVQLWLRVGGYGAHCLQLGKCVTDDSFDAQAQAGITFSTQHQLLRESQWQLGQRSVHVRAGSLHQGWFEMQAALGSYESEGALVEAC